VIQSFHLPFLFYVGLKIEPTHESSKPSLPINESLVLSRDRQRIATNKINKIYLILIKLKFLMEVHHPHHAGQNKNWKEYITEFFMLFFAITLGFFAENIREIYIESHREKEYMQTMVQDLKEDTSRINQSIALSSVKANAMDSLIRNIYAKPYNDSSMRVMYYLFRKYMAAGTDVSFSQRTINQLINSGNLRLIKDISISDSIVSYDINIQKILQQYIIFHDQYQQTAREISNRIFDSYYLLDYTRSTAQGLLNTNVKLKLLNDDEKILKEYANVVYGGKGVLNAYVNMLKAQKIRAKIIIEILTKAYGLE